MVDLHFPKEPKDIVLKPYRKIFAGNLLLSFNTAYMQNWHFPKIDMYLLRDKWAAFKGRG